MTFIGLDGGGTRTRIAIADGSGRELIRRSGPAGLIDPAAPEAVAAALMGLVRATALEAGVELPATALCAGLAGAGTEDARAAVDRALSRAGLAHRVAVVSDGEVALDGALGEDAGVLLIAGTGSVAFGRSEDGRIGRCGGWGQLVGDEGSGYTIARAGLKAALQAVDGRGPSTRLLPDLLDHLGLTDHREIPGWVARTSKGEVAALAPRVARLANDGDGPAARIVEAAAGHLADHVEALLDRLGPWSGDVPVVFAGGALEDPGYAARVEARVAAGPHRVARRAAAADAVTGALRHAVRLAGAERAD